VASAAARERIISAALDIIGREGVRGFTVRRVTKAANVNVALVSYHFKSKQALVDEALAHYFRGVMEVFAILDQEDVPPAVTLRRFVEAYWDNLFTHPGAFISQIMVMVDQSMPDTGGAPGGWTKLSPSFLAMQKDGTGRLKSVLAEILGTKDEALVGLRALPLLTSLTHPMFLSGFPRALFNTDVRSRAVRARYIDLVMETAVCAPPTVGGR